MIEATFNAIAPTPIIAEFEAIIPREKALEVKNKNITIEQNGTYTVKADADTTMTEVGIEVDIPYKTRYVEFNDSAFNTLVAEEMGYGIGLTDEQVRKITTIPNQFAENNTEIKNLSDLRKFSKLTSIGNYAFRGCSGLTSIEIPNSVTSIGDYAFSGYTLENLTIEDTSKITSMSTIGNTIIKNLYVNDLKPLYKFKFRTGNYNNNSTNIYVNEELVKDVFIDYIEGVNDVTLLFQGSTITSVKIAEGYTTANNGPFECCYKIQLVDFPSTIQSINWIRYMATNVKLIVRAVTPPSVSAFFGSYGSIYVPNESVEAYKTATGWSNFAVRIKPLSEYVES